MSTNSTIAVQLEDGSIKQVYCHWDGYIEYNGKMLVAHYNTVELADVLVSLGNISSLGERIAPNGVHTFDNPETGATVFYGRDRGEGACEYQSYSSYGAYLQHSQNEEYNYLFRDGRWECAFNNRTIIVSEYA